MSFFIYSEHFKTGKSEWILFASICTDVDTARWATPLLNTQQTSELVVPWENVIRSAIFKHQHLITQWKELKLSVFQTTDKTYHIIGRGSNPQNALLITPKLIISLLIISLINKLPINNPKLLWHTRVPRNSGRKSLPQIMKLNVLLSSESKTSTSYLMRQSSHKLLEHLLFWSLLHNNFQYLLFFL